MKIDERRHNSENFAISAKFSLFWTYGLTVTYLHWVACATPQTPKTSHARVRSNFARVLEWSCSVVVLSGSGESEIADSSSNILSGWSVNIEYRTATAEYNFF